MQHLYLPLDPRSKLIVLLAPCPCDRCIAIDNEVPVPVVRREMDAMVHAQTIDHSVLRKLADMTGPMIWVMRGRPPCEASMDICGSQQMVHAADEIFTLSIDKMLRRVKSRWGVKNYLLLHPIVGDL